MDVYIYIHIYISAQIFTEELLPKFDVDDSGAAFVMTAIVVVVVIT